MIQIIEAWQISENLPEVLTKLGLENTPANRSKINLMVSNLIKNGVKLKDINQKMRLDYDFLKKVASAALKNGDSKKK